MITVQSALYWTQNGQAANTVEQDSGRETLAKLGFPEASHQSVESSVDIENRTGQTAERKAYDKSTG